MGLFDLTSGAISRQQAAGMTPEEKRGFRQSYKNWQGGGLEGANSWNAPNQSATPQQNLVNFQQSLMNQRRSLKDAALAGDAQAQAQRQALNQVLNQGRAGGWFFGGNRNLETNPLKPSNPNYLSPNPIQTIPPVNYAGPDTGQTGGGGGNMPGNNYLPADPLVEATAFNPLWALSRGWF